MHSKCNSVSPHDDSSCGEISEGVCCGVAFARARQNAVPWNVNVCNS